MDTIDRHSQSKYVKRVHRLQLLKIRLKKLKCAIPQLALVYLVLQKIEEDHYQVCLVSQVVILVIMRDRKIRERIIFRKENHHLQHPIIEVVEVHLREGNVVLLHCHFRRYKELLLNVCYRYDRKSSPPRREIVQARDLRFRERERERERDRNLMPWQKSNYSRTKPPQPLETKPKPDKVDEYKKLCKAIDNDMDRIFTQHKKNPEKHTQYNDEWKKFWNKRYKELQTEGKDVSSHDFKPEWIIFWSNRMSELHQEEVKIKKEALRKRLGLPDEPSPISFRIKKKSFGEQGKTSPNDNKPLPTAAMPDNDPEVIVIDDKDDESKGSRRSHSPWEDEPKRARSRASREKSRDTSRYVLK